MTYNWADINETMDEDYDTLNIILPNISDIIDEELDVTKIKKQFDVYCNDHLNMDFSEALTTFSKK
tara:strand:- start:705 stop:902 length:198 start_codon:yes stop_codon:yes gene_type:complete